MNDPSKEEYTAVAMILLLLRPVARLLGIGVVGIARLLLWIRSRVLLLWILWLLWVGHAILVGGALVIATAIAIRLVWIVACRHWRTVIWIWLGRVGYVGWLARIGLLSSWTRWLRCCRCC